MAGYSFDGGRNWRQTTLPFSTCAPGSGPYDRVSPPYVSFGADGTAYAIAGSFEAVGIYPRSVVTATSTDGGRSWHRLRALASYPAGGIRASVTGDPVRPGWAYAAWQTLVRSADGSVDSTGFFARSTDRGATWSTPIAFTGTGAESAFNNHVLVDARTGQLFVTYESCLGETCNVAYRSSVDSGRTWSGEQAISAQRVAEPILPQPGTAATVETLDPPVSAIAMSGGTIAVAWIDSRFSGGRYDEIAVSVSRDRGRHWTTPHRANTATGGPAVLPAVAVTRHGTLGLTYYDARRDDASDAPFSVDLWATTSHDGVVFRRSRHLAGSFDVLGAPGNGQHLFLGQSTGLAAVGRHFVSVFLASTCAARPCPADNPSDVYSTQFSTRTSDL